MKHQTQLSKTREFLHRHIKETANARALEWLEQQQENYAGASVGKGKIRRLADRLKRA
jgi:hypothetical protein